MRCAKGRSTFASRVVLAIGATVLTGCTAAAPPDVLQSAATFPTEQQQQQQAAAAYGQAAVAAAHAAAAAKQDGNQGGLNDLLGLESELSK